jgi:outer membrane lipoprotein SlyB
VLGHQIGSGRGNTAATVLGAAGGAYAGHQVEKSNKTTTTYQVVVKMEEGNTRYFNFSKPTSYQIGDKVKIVDKKLVHR